MPKRKLLSAQLSKTLVKHRFLINKFIKMRKDLQHLTNEQKEYLAEKIRKKISAGGYSIWADSEQCFNRIKSALEIKYEKNTH